MRTPLQQWAWERFRFKGAVTASIALLGGFKYVKNVSESELLFIDEAIASLNKIIKVWNQNHQGTRRMANEQKET